MRLRPQILLLTCLILPLGGVASGTDGSARLVRAENDSLTFEIRPPAPRRAAAGSFRPPFRSPEGYFLAPAGTPSDPRDDLPLREERIALPPEGEAHLEVLELRTRPLPGAPAPEAAMAVTLPHLRLGGEGRLRHLRYIPLEVRPVVAAEGGWSLLISAVVRIHLPPAPSGGAPPSTESSLFGEIYRRAVGNPGQVRRFLERPRRRQARFGPRSLSTNRVRLEVSREGLHRVSPEWLRSQGVDLDAGGVASASLGLTLDRQDVAFHVEDGGDGLWGDGPAGQEWIEFHGFPRLGEDEPDVWESGDFTDTNVFWLSTGGANPLRVPEAPSEGGAPPLLASFPWTQRFEEDTFFLGNSLGTGVTHWFYPLVVSVNGPAAGNPFRVEAPLPGLVPGTAGALRYEILGRSSDDTCDPDHVALVCTGGADSDCVPGGTGVVAEEVWDGFTLHEGEIPLDASRLVDPLDLRLAAPDGDPRRCTEVDVLALNWFEVTYPRSTTARDDRLLLTPPAGTWRFEVDGFTDPVGRPASVWDVTDPLAPVRIQPEAPQADRVPFQWQAVDGTRLALASGDGFLLPDGAREEAGPDLRQPASARYLIIAAQEILDGDAGGGETGRQVLERLVAHRLIERPDLSTRIISVEAVLDQFGEGIKDPRVLREFLRSILDPDSPTVWDEPPEAVLLVGDASVDVKDNKGIGGNLIPTILVDTPSFEAFGWLGSEGRLATVLGTDDLADMIVGRLPVRSAAELQQVVDKIIRYETDAPAADPLQWRARLAMTADEPANATEAQRFEGTHDQLAADLATTPFVPSMLYYSQYADPLVYRDDLTAFLDGGALLWSYAGHGNHIDLSNDKIFSTIRLDAQGNDFWQPADLALINHSLGMPLLVHANCLTGQFMFVGEADGDPDPDVYDPVPLESMAELFVEKPDGGAIAAIAPAGLTFVGQTGTIIRESYDSLLDEPGWREAGRVWFSVLLAVGPGLERTEMVLIGDPLSRIAVPGPSGVEDVAAAGDNARVDLTWTANPAGENVADYRVQRFHNQVSDWEELALVPASPTPSYADTDVTNGTTYFYRVAAVDDLGFRGPWSRVAQATPLNLNPPGAPQDVTAQVTGPDTIQVDWTPNPPEDDVATWHILYGTSPDDPRTPELEYTKERDLPFFAAPPTNLTGVDTSVLTCLCVRAANNSGVTGPCSQEVCVGGPEPTGSAVPWRPTLQVSRNGSDVVLAWDHVVFDVWGRQKSDVATYEIFRETSPDFRRGLDPETDTVTCPCPDELSWIDPNPLGAPGACEGTGDCLVFYSTPAVDAAGEVSGLAGSVPRPVENLQAVPQGPRTQLSWDPVTRDLRGADARILEYRIYGSNDPADVDRATLRSSPAYLGSVGPGTTETLVDSFSEYLVIAVDDKGAWSP